MQNNPDLQTELDYARMMLSILEEDNEKNERALAFYRERIVELETELIRIKDPQDKYPQDKYAK
ncbi:MAG: hypothetical protein IH586_22360 [Anaerolineaceae bacterium]|nr:hypothetical protein [Anaerolineaceae bacterium]